MEAEYDQSGTIIDDISSNSGADDASPRRTAICGGELLDIEAYAALYSGRTKIRRLLFFADKCNDTPMQLEALRMAYEEIKRGSDTRLFRDVVQKIDGRLGPDYGLDRVWIDAENLRAEKTKKRLENEQTSYMKNYIKESIRMGFNDFGDFYYSRGQLADSLKSYYRTRDYSSTSNHIIHTCLNVILVSIEMSQFLHITTYANKVEQIQDALDPITMSKLCCAVGLAHLEDTNYKLAARKFLEVGQELRNHYMEVIAPQDVATYGGLCALASFERAELKSKVIDNVNFKVFLELVPELREVIHEFYACHYALCFEYLGNLKANLLLDIHLHDHVETLYSQIRNKALIQYTHPFVSVDLHIMSNAFKTTVPGLEKELQSMITNDQIKARIDSHNKILYARHEDQRKTTFEKALHTGSEFDRDMRAMLLRANLVMRDPSSSKEPTWIIRRK